MYVVVIFLLLWALFQFILCNTVHRIPCGHHYPDSEHEYLYLVQTNEHLHSEKNQQFLNLLADGTKVPLGAKLPFTSSIRVLYGCSSRIEDIISDTTNLKYVIHLHVDDFYQNNYNYVIKKGFSWAGDVDNSDGKLTEVCKFNGTKGKGTLEREKNELCIPHKAVLKKRVKLVSKEVMSISYLYNLTLYFQYKQSVPKLYKNIDYKILVCITKINSIHKYYKRLTFDDAVVNIKAYYSYRCNDNFGSLRDEEIIAILAPNASAIQETHKPVIFYDETYSLPGDTAFYNSIIRIRSWKALSETFLRFMRRMQWNRVAVLSDDSIESAAFEEELRRVFDEGGVSYIVMTVTETKQKYNFYAALSALKQAEARIIVANIDERHADQLARLAKQQGMTSSGMILWLARDWSAATAREAAQNMGTVFSVIPNQAIIPTFIKAIDRVIEHNKHNKTYNYLNETQFASDIRQSLGSIDETLANVTQTTTKESKIIAFYKDGKWNIRKHQKMPQDRKGDCSIKSSNYYKPCHDLVVIYFMLVIAVLSVTVLGITYFFQTPDTPYNRMIN